jgi:hypothetical protein
MGIHLFHWVDGEKKMISYDIVQNALPSIARDVDFHVACEQTHVLPSPSL